MTTYLDCNATTPVEPRVAEVVTRFLVEDFGNAGSRTHEYGVRAKKAVEAARSWVAGVADSDPSEVVFTSGATESNNLAILGLADALETRGRTHIVSTAIEHKAVLEPLELLKERGFAVELVAPRADGRIEVDHVVERLRPETGLVSVMHVNNETGVIQPVEAIREALADTEIFFHVDAAQGFGKLSGLELAGVDLVSVSGHKMFGPKGIGALIARRSGYVRPPLAPLMVGGGQERGMRPGTLPVHLVAGLGEAARLASKEHSRRAKRCEALRADLLRALADVPHQVNGDLSQVIPSTINVSVTGVESEAAIVCLKGIAAVSNGAACTSASYTTSHVLRAMGLEEARIRSSLRISWCHLTPAIPGRQIRQILRRLAG
ncbi:MAG: cysteine desulfurase DndA [Gemmatimonadota bacterium]|nr:cysteine desulfurase DndA [Gemmatimonadota bacterium]